MVRRECGGRRKFKVALYGSYELKESVMVALVVTQTGVLWGSSQKIKSGSSGQHFAKSAKSLVLMMFTIYDSLKYKRSIQRVKGKVFFQKPELDSNANLLNKENGKRCPSNAVIGLPQGPLVAAKRAD